jgi:hypothetical protein
VGADKPPTAAVAAAVRADEPSSAAVAAAVRADEQSSAAVAAAVRADEPSSAAVAAAVRADEPLLAAAAVVGADKPPTSTPPISTPLPPPPRLSAFGFDWPGTPGTAPVAPEGASARLHKPAQASDLTLISPLAQALRERFFAVCSPCVASAPAQPKSTQSCAQPAATRGANGSATPDEYGALVAVFARGEMRSPAVQLSATTRTAQQPLSRTGRPLRGRFAQTPWNASTARSSNAVDNETSASAAQSDAEADDYALD